MSAFASMMMLASASPVPVAWECSFLDREQSSFLMRGIVRRTEGFLPDDYEDAKQITLDESGRYEGKLLRGPYFIRPAPGKIWLVFNAQTKEGLLMDFSSEDGSGSADLIRGDFDNPIAVGECTFEDADK